MNLLEQSDSLIKKLGLEYSIELASETYLIWNNRLLKEPSDLNRNSVKYWGAVPMIIDEKYKK